MTLSKTTKELDFLVLVRNDSLGSWLPVCWTHNTMLICMLKCLDCSDGLIHISTNRCIVYRQ